MRIECHAVHALHLFARLIAAPVRARHARQLETVRIDLPVCSSTCGPAAQIGERPGLVDADLSDAFANEVRVVEFGHRRCSAGLQIAQQLHFEVLMHAAEHRDGLVRRNLRSLERQSLSHLLPHRLLDLGKILRRQGAARD